MMRKTILVRMMTFDNFRIIILEYNIIKNHIKNLFKNHIFVRNDIKLNHIKKHIENILKQPFKTKNNIKTTVAMNFEEKKDKPEVLSVLFLFDFASLCSHTYTQVRSRFFACPIASLLLDPGLIEVNLSLFC